MIVWNYIVCNYGGITFQKERNHDFYKYFYKISIINGLVSTLRAFSIRKKFGAPGGFLVPLWVVLLEKVSSRGTEVEVRILTRDADRWGQKIAQCGIF